MKIKLLIFSLLFSVVGWTQTSLQNFGAGTGSNTTQTGSTVLIPNPTSGTTYARGGAVAPNAPIVLATASNPLSTTGTYVRAVSSSSASVAKVTPIAGYTGGTEFYTSFKVLFGDASAGNTATSGVWTFYQGAGANYTDNNDAATAQVFTGLRFTFGAAGALTLTYNNNGTYNSTSLTTSAFSQGTVYTIEIVGNNKTSGTINYTYNCTAQTVAVQKFDLYINGTLVGNDLTKGTLPVNTTINATTFTGVSSAANVANLFLDDEVIYNAVPAAIGTSSHTVTFNNNGGSGSMTPQTACSATALTANTFTNAGNTFAGWNTVAGGGGTAYTDGQSYNFSADITLYAQWTPVGCTPPTDPSGAINVTQNCGSTNLSVPTPNANWFWQTSAGGTDQSFPTTAAYNPTVAGTYYVRAYDGSSCWSTGTISQAITVLAPVAITTGPNPSAITVGANTSFAVTATGSGLTYQWQEDSGSGFVNLSNGGVYSTVTTATMNITGATLAMNGYNYRCIVSGTAPCLAATSGNALLTVTAAPCFSEDFASIVTGDNVTTGGSSTAWVGNANFPAAGNSNAFNAGGAVRIGASAATGFITSKALTGLSGALTVMFDVKGWTTVEGNIKVTLGGNVQTVTYAALMGGSFETKTLNFTGIADGSTLKIETTAKRAFIDNVKIICGAPLSTCGTPTAQPTILNFSSVTTTAFNGSFTAASPAPTGYLVVYSTDATLSAGDLPVDGTNYTVGNTIGDGTVAYAGTGTSFSVSGLTSGVTYYTFVFSYNSGACITAYDTTTPLIGNITTPTITNDLCTAATVLTVNAPATAGNMTGSTFNAPFTKNDVWYTFTPTCSGVHNITVTGFTGDIDIEMFSGSCPATTTILDGSAGTTSTETFSPTLTAGTVYYLRVLAFNAAAQTSAFTAQVTSASSLALTNAGSPATGNISMGATNAVIMGFTTTPSCATTSYDVTSVALTKAATSTALATDLSNFRIVYDADGNGAMNGAEASVSGAGIAIATTMNFTIAGQTGITTARKYLLVADVSGAAVNGRTIKVNLSPNSNLVAPLTPAGTGTGTALGNTQTIVVPACTPAVVSNVTPASGPEGTEVTITVSSGNLVGATATFNGVAAIVVSSSATQLVVKVPAGATTGNLVVTNSALCSSTGTAFTVIDKDKTSCEGTILINDLFISEVTDASSGSLSYVEIYNGTTSTINMANYAVRFTNYNNKLNDGNPGVDVDLPLTGSLAPGGKFIFATSVGTPCGTPGADGSLANQSGVHSGINNNDLVSLVKLGTVIDVWGVADDTMYWITDVAGLGTEGYDFERKNSVVVPSTTFNINDWVIHDWNACNDDYSNIATYVTTNTTPGITVQPTLSLTCTSTSASVSVTATEGFVGSNPLVYQWYAVAPNTAAWTALSDGGVYSGTGNSVLNISSIATLEGYQYYCQVRENGVTCYVATKAVKIDTGATVWNGSVWSNGTPTSSKTATINGTYNTTTNGNIDACSIVINSPFTATITDGMYFNIQNDVTVNAGGTLDILNNGSLVQVNDAGVNTGNIKMHRTATVKLQDYVYWSSPVANFDVANVSPSTPTGYIWKWNPTVANTNGGQGNWQGASGIMTLGEGRIVRAPSGYSNASTTPFTANFTGVANNGVITPAISRGSDLGAGSNGPNGVMRTTNDDNWNLLGNPYPSAIGINAFLTANPSIDGFVRLWTHGTLPNTGISSPFYGSFAYNYTTADYIAVNGAGATSGPGLLSVVGAGQGFFVLMNPGAATTSSVTFNNSMRNSGFSNSQFYRSENLQGGQNLGTNLESHRIWLDLVGAGETTRTLVAYVDGATVGRDRFFDAVTENKSTQNFYSLLGNDIMTIQGKGLPFDANDTVPMGIKITTNGTYSIAIAAVDGLFKTMSQKIYIEDKLLHTINDITVAPYQFTANQGVINDRFVLRYTDQALHAQDFSNIENGVSVYPSNNEIRIGSSIENIKDYVVYNVLGQVLAIKNKVNANETLETSIMKNNQTLIVKVTLENGLVVTRKIIF